MYLQTRKPQLEQDYTSFSRALTDYSVNTQRFGPIHNEVTFAHFATLTTGFWRDEFRAFVLSYDKPVVEVFNTVDHWATGEERRRAYWIINSGGGPLQTYLYYSDPNDREEWLTIGFARIDEHENYKTGFYNKTGEYTGKLQSTRYILVDYAPNPSGELGQYYSGQTITKTVETKGLSQITLKGLQGKETVERIHLPASIDFQSWVRRLETDAETVLKDPAASYLKWREELGMTYSARLWHQSSGN